MKIHKIGSAICAFVLLLSLSIPAKAVAPQTGIANAAVPASVNAIYEQIFSTGGWTLSRTPTVIGTGEATDYNNTFQVCLYDPEFTGKVAITAKIGSRTYIQEQNVVAGSYYTNFVFYPVSIQMGAPITVTSQVTSPFGQANGGDISQAKAWSYYED